MSSWAISSIIANPLVRRLAGWLPGFAIVRTVGRRTGQTHRSPLNVFRRDGDYVMALVYGPTSTG